VTFVAPRVFNLLTRCSIEAFGGDPKRITVFGQSAGGASVDFLAYGYPKDPIINGIIPQSGSAGNSVRTASPDGPNNPAVQNWSQLSQQLGCGVVPYDDVTKTLICMRSKPASAVLSATAPKTTGDATRAWGVKLDPKTGVFGDMPTRGARGDFAKVVSAFIQIRCNLRKLTTTDSPFLSEMSTMKAHLLMLPLAPRRQRRPTVHRTLRHYFAVTKASQLGDIFMLESSQIMFLDRAVKMTREHGRSHCQCEPTNANNPTGMVQSWL
jgi:carboxylesterase type B